MFSKKLLPSSNGWNRHPRPLPKLETFEECYAAYQQGMEEYMSAIDHPDAVHAKRLMRHAKRVYMSFPRISAYELVKKINERRMTKFFRSKQTPGDLVGRVLSFLPPIEIGFYLYKHRDLIKDAAVVRIMYPYFQSPKDKYKYLVGGNDTLTGLARADSRFFVYMDTTPPFEYTDVLAVHERLLAHYQQLVPCKYDEFQFGKYRNYHHMLWSFRKRAYEHVWNEFVTGFLLMTFDEFLLLQTFDTFPTYLFTGASLSMCIMRTRDKCQPKLENLMKFHGKKMKNWDNTWLDIGFDRRIEQSEAKRTNQ